MHALVVGIDAYTGGIPLLDSARNDAQAVADILAKQHGYEVTSLLDGEARSAAVTDFLTATVPPRLSADTPFLFYFAGHGVAENDDGTKGPQGYLMLHDSIRGNQETYLSMDAVRQALDELPCRHVLVVLDCCYAGAFRWATPTRGIGLVARPALYKSVYERYLDGEAWQALTSASVDQRAADAVAGLANLRGANTDGHSPFAAALIRGLEGAADFSTDEFPPDGVITATELHQYVTTCLLPASNAPTVQTPGIWPLRRENLGEFVFLNPKVKLNVVPDPPLDDSNNPWLGLDGYTAEEAELYFGREDETDALVARVAAFGTTGGLVAVVGPSGAGKTSLVQAGLIASLDPAKWTVVQAAPLAGDPNAALEAAVKQLEASPRRRRKLLFFDGFEELYTQGADATARARFLAGLRELVDGKGGATMVLTLRSDFELRAAAEDALKDIWQAARYQVPPFTGDELRRLILAPAHVRALYFDPAKIADDLFDEVVQTPGALPLLSFALAELYRQAQLRRQKTGAADRGLTSDDYDAIGGVTGALNQRATELYDKAAPDEQQAIRRVFVRLVAQEGAALTGRRVDLTELQFGNGDDAEQQRVDRVVKLYADAGLLVIGADSVEPAHDALVAQWQELHKWLKAGSQDLIRAAWGAACAWEENGRAAGRLWNSDPRLPQLAEANRDGNLNATERAFEIASTRRRKSKMWQLGATIAAVMAAIAAAAGFAWLQRNQAIQQRDAATSRAFAAQAVQALTSAPKTALADSIQAVEASPTVEAHEALERALVANPVLYAVLGTKKFKDPNKTLAFSDDGRLLLVLQDRTLHVLRSTDGRPVEPPIPGMTHALFGPGARVLAASSRIVRLSGPELPSHVRRVPRGDHVVAVGFAGKSPLALVAGHGAAEVLDVATGTAVRLHGRWAPASDAVFSKVGNRVLVDTNGGSRVWSTDTGRLVATLRSGDPVAVLSPDGKLAASPAGLWSVDTRRRIVEFASAARVSFGPEARELVAVDSKGNASIYRTSDGKQVAELPNLGSPFPSSEIPVWEPDAVFSHDGRLVGVTDPDGYVRVWEVATKEQVAAVRAGWAETLAFAPQGGLLASMTWDGEVLVTRAPASVGIETGYPTGGGDTPPTLVGPGGAYVVAAGGGGSAGVWSIAGKRLQRFASPGRNPRDRRVVYLAASGDGRVIALDAAEFAPPGPLWTKLWRLGSRAPFLRLPSSDGEIMLDPHGLIVALNSKAWDTGTGQRLRRLDGIVALSRDGHRALVRRDRTAAIVSVPSGAMVAVLHDFGPLAADNFLTAEFSPNDTRLLTARYEGPLRLWDATSGALIRLLAPTAEMSNPFQDAVFAFGGGGRLVRAVLVNRAATFDAADGSEVHSAAGSFAAISPDGRSAAVANPDGTVGVVDLETGTRVTIPTDTATKLTDVSFAKRDLIVATDEDGYLHILPCMVCAPERTLLLHARATLSRLSHFNPQEPPIEPRLD